MVQEFRGVGVEENEEERDSRPKGPQQQDVLRQLEDVLPVLSRWDQYGALPASCLRLARCLEMPQRWYDFCRHQVLKEVGKIGDTVVVAGKDERLALFQWAISDAPKVGWPVLPLACPHLENPSPNSVSPATSPGQP